MKIEIKDITPLVTKTLSLNLTLTEQEFIMLGSIIGMVTGGGKVRELCDEIYAEMNSQITIDANVAGKFVKSPMKLKEV